MKKPSSTAKHRAYWFGIYAEWLVIASLFLRGYRILKRRYRRRGVGEVDIIAVRGNILVMIEVKARRQRNRNDFPEVLSARQRDRIRRAAGAFVAAHRQYDRHTVRFDLALVSPYRWPSYVVNAW